MTIQQAIDILQAVPNKNAELVMMNTDDHIAKCDRLDKPYGKFYSIDGGEYINENLNN